MKTTCFVLLCVFNISLKSQSNANASYKKIGVVNKNMPGLIIKKIELEPLTEWLCPTKLLRGDREFGGNGPKIKCEASLRITNDSSALELNVKLWAQETVHDWSTTEGSWKRIVYEAPYGQKINRIISDKASRTQFISPKAGYQIFVPGADFPQVIYDFFDQTDITSKVLNAFGIQGKRNSQISNLIKTSIDHSNQIVQVPPIEGTLVKFFHIVGDTGAEDISTDNNCNDDTRIHKIEFFPVSLEFAIRQ